jgi:mono/diheme cytochrome c family protein
MKTVTTVVVVVLVVVASALAMIVSGFYHVGASVPHGGFTSWALHTTMARSVARRAADIPVPDLSTEEMRLAGINDFEAMCAVCHTAPGTQASGLARGLNPPAPDLAQSAEELSPQELFWVTKHGIRMTGMPAWGTTHSDEEIWPVVAFMRTLPGLRVAQYREMLEAAKGRGHHAGEAAEAGHEGEGGHHETGDAAPAAEHADDHEHAAEDEPH